MHHERLSISEEIQNERSFDDERKVCCRCLTSRTRAGRVVVPTSGRMFPYLLSAHALWNITRPRYPAVLRERSPFS